MTSNIRAEVEIWPFCVCAMHPAIIIGTVGSLCTWLWGRYHVPQNVFIVQVYVFACVCVVCVAGWILM